MKKIMLDGTEESIEKDIHRYKKLSAKNSKRIERIISKENEKRNICLRVNKHDLEQLRLRAQKEGMPYQTFISSILHKFVTDQLINQQDIIKTIQIIHSDI